MRTLLATKGCALFAFPLVLALLMSACTLPFGGTSQPTPCSIKLPTGGVPAVSSIVVQNGVVYAGAYEVPLAGLTRSYVYAFDARTGSQLWRDPIVPPTVSINVAAVVAGVVYVGFDNYSDRPNQFSVLALRASDGSLVWSATTGSIDLSSLASPVLAVIDGVVYATGTTPTDLDPSATLYALRASDGKLLWQRSGPTDAASPFSVPTAVGTVLYAYTGTVEGSAYGSIYALRASNGQVIWSHRWQSQLATPFAAPLVVDGVLYTSVMATGSAYALRASDGTVLWHAQVAQSAFGAPLVTNGLVYVVEGAQNEANTALYALDAGTGTTRWRFQSASLPASLPVLEDAAAGLVYVDEPENTSGGTGLFALDGLSGALRWVHHTAGPLYGPVNGIIYVRAILDGDVEALDALGGNLVWRAPIATNPAFTVGSGGVYFGSGGYRVVRCAPPENSGYLYALDARTGAVLWRYQTDGRPGQTSSSPPLATSGCRALPRERESTRRATKQTGVFEDTGFILEAGQAAYTFVNGLCAPTSTSWCRWGDYLAASFDGFGSNTVWLSGEYSTATGNWGTWIGKDQFTLSTP